MWKITVDEKLCERCGICSELCPTKVFTLAPDELPIFTYQEKCIGCELCVLYCPDLALRLTKEED